MTTYTETTTLDEKSHDLVNNVATATWRTHLFKDGEEVDSARVAHTKTYQLPEQQAEFEQDTSANPPKVPAE